MVKRKVTKSFSTILGVEKSKKINTCLSTNIKIILDSFFMVHGESVSKSETILHGFFIIGVGKVFFFVVKRIHVCI